MKCEEIRILIEDYVDSALDQKAAAFVNSHIADCAACASFHRELSREQDIYARYERDVEVTPGMWASIETRIKQERAAPPLGLLSRLREQFAGMFAAPRLTPAFAAALVIMAILVTAGVMSYLNSHGRETAIAGNSNKSNQFTEGNNNRTSIPESPAPGSSKESTVAANGGARTEVQERRPKADKNSVPQKHFASTSTPTPAQLVREAEQKYLTAIAMLSRDVNRQRSQLDPILLARFDASLSDIDRTIKETRRVVRENPGDPIALQYLLAAYSKKVEVLRGMTAD